MGWRRHRIQRIVYVNVLDFSLGGRKFCVHDAFPLSPDYSQLSPSVEIYDEDNYGNRDEDNSKDYAQDGGNQESLLAVAC